MERLAVTKKVGTWVAATVVAALLGAAIKTAYDRAVPRVSIVQVRPSLEANKMFETSIKEVSVPDSLKKTAEKTLWTSISGFREQFSEYKEHIAALADNEQKMIRFTNSISSFERDKQRMREIARRADEISEDEAVEFFDLWERNDGYIYGSLRGKYRRGSFSLADHKYEGTPKLVVRQDDDKDWYVTRRGSRFRSMLAKQSSTDAALQEEVAKSLAYMKKERLLAYMKLVEEDSADIDIAKQVLAEIRSARLNISRLSVTVQIENSGSTAISFIPYAELEVETTGVLQNGKQLDGKTLVQLEYRSGSPGEPTAIQIAANSSQLLSLSSSQFIGELPNSSSLVRILDLGTSKCILRMFTAGGGSFAKDTYASTPVTFAKLEPTARNSK